MELKGKKIVFLGDSITQGCGTTAPEKSFVYLVGERGEFRESKNYGIAGTRIARQHKPYAAPEFDRDFCMRIEELDEDADIVVIFGGVNDFGHGDAPIGTFGDRDPNTFYGACHYLYRRALERFPGKPIVILTPLHRWGEFGYKGDGFKAYNYGTLKDYVNIIREVAEYYSLPILDLYAVSGMQPDVEIIREKLMPDRLHPNDAGHEILAEKILAFLKAM